MKILSYIGHTYNFKKFAEAFPEHTFHVLDENHIWDIMAGTQPPNVFLNAEHTNNYDIAKGSTLNQCRKIREFYNGYLVGLTHGYTEPEAFGGLPDAMVFQNKRNMQDVNHHNKYLIPHYIEGDTTQAYTGDISCVLSVVNNLANRPELLPQLYDNITAGYSRVVIGSNPKIIRGGIGQVKMEEVPHYYRHFRCFVYTANKDCGMSHVVLEALINGCPVVINDFSDWADYIVNGISGFVSDNLIRIRDIIYKLMGDIEYARYIGGNGRKIALEHFNKELYIERWNKIFEDAK